MSSDPHSPPDSGHPKASPAPKRLRTAPGRSVDFCEDPQQQTGKIVKRFRARAHYARPFDKARAHREFEGLRALEALGVRVPHAVEIGQDVGDGWFVSLEAIPNAITATEALQTTTRRSKLLAELARLLASLHNAGVDQRDLHGGNALVDPQGQAYGIDFHSARLRGRGALGRAVLSRDMSVLCASHREWITPRERARFFLTWSRALHPDLASQLGGRSELALQVEKVGIQMRRKACARYEQPSSRWFRDSGSCRLSKGGLYARRELSTALCETLQSSVSHDEGSLPKGLWLFRGSESEVRTYWGRAARLDGHRLPGPRPCLMSLGAEPWVLLEFSPNGSPDAPLGEWSFQQLSIAPTDEEFGTLSAELSERGLQLSRGLAAAFWTTKNGVLCLSPHAELIAQKRSSANGKSKQKRRESRQKWFDYWPLLQAPPIRPIVNMGLQSLAAGARWTRLQAALLDNLSVAFPGPENLSKRRQIARHARHHMARLAGEWGRLGRGETERDWLESRVTLDKSVQLFDEQLARGRGVLIVTPHLGNWELLAPKLVARGCRGAVVGRRRLRDPGGALLEQMRAPWGFETLPQDGSPREILRRLRDGQVIGILPDLEVPRLAGIRLPFLGKEALVMTAPAALARAARVPLLPATCVLDETAGSGPNAHSPYRIRFAPPIERLATDDNEPATRAWISVFENWIREAPSQWVWYQDRWRTPPSPADAIPLATLRAAQRKAKS